VLQDAEVEEHDHADEDLEQQDELALRDQVGLAGLVDQLGHLEHRAVHRHVLEAHEDRHAEGEAQQAHDQAAHEQRAAVDAQERFAAQVGQHEIGLAGVRLGLDGRRGSSSRYRLGGRGRGKGQRQNQRGEEKEEPELSEH
jgi:hypothetical protein